MNIQVIMLILSFIIMAIMLRRKMNFGVTMIITATILALSAGQNLSEYLNTLLTTITAENTIETCGAVFTIGILGGLLSRFGILNRIVADFGNLISSRKIIAMIIPAIIGLLPVPGGAVMSVPFVDTLGNDLEMSAQRKSAINLVFRHVGIMIMPFSSTLLMVGAILPSVGVYGLIPYNLVFMICLFAAGYFVYISDLKPKHEYKASPSFKTFASLMINLSPIYVCVLTSIIFGLPIYMGALVSLVVVYLISDKSDFFSKFKASLNFNMLLTIFGVMLLQNVIGSLDQMLNSFQSMVGDGIFGMVILSLGGAFFSFITGLSLTSYGIVLPLLAGLALPDNTTLVFAYSIFICSYIGYYFSPLHLCQVFTNEYLKVETGTLYKEYTKYFLFAIISGVLCIATVAFFML